MSPQTVVLVIEDERRITDIVKTYLEREGYKVLTAPDGQTGLDTARRERPDLVILDLMLPEIPGLEVCRLLRAEAPLPIIMLTARSDEADKIVGLGIGADDYVTKPFSPRELVARVQAVLRRTRLPGPAQAQRKQFGDLAVDFMGHTIYLRDREIELTPTEFKLLEILTVNPGRVFSRLELIEHIYDFAYEGYERTIDTHIKNLRRKIDNDAAEPRFIKTVYGVGYKFDANQN